MDLPDNKRVALTRPEITLKGLEYFGAEQSDEKAWILVKGIAETAANMISTTSHKWLGGILRPILKLRRRNEGR